MSHQKVIRHWPRLATMGLVLTIVATAGCSSPKIKGKIGLVDPARLLNDSNAGKKAKESLDQIVDQLPNAKHWIVVVNGNTDSVGDAEYNYVLSKRRADDLDPRPSLSNPGQRRIPNHECLDGAASFEARSLCSLAPQDDG